MITRDAWELYRKDNVKHIAAPTTADTEYTLTALDRIILVTVGAAYDVILTLPAPIVMIGPPITIQKVDADTTKDLEVLGNANDPRWTDLVDGTSLDAQWDHLVVWSDGTRYYILKNGIA